MQHHKISKILRLFFTVSALVLFARCQKHSDDSVSDINLVRVGDPAIVKEIGDAKHRFLVLGEKSYRTKILSHQLFSPGSDRAKMFLNGLTVTSTLGGLSEERSPTPGDGSLIAGFPATLLKEAHVFGGVVTAVTDTTNETLGRLKLANLTPLHVSLELVKISDQLALGLRGCVADCTDSSPLVPLLAIPVTAVDPEKQLIMLDLATLGVNLDLMKIMDPKGQVTQLKSKLSKTVLFDYSNSTLVFDVESHLIPLNASDTDPSVPVTVVTTRWYLRQALALDALFQSRPATDGVGFFLTERNRTPKVMRRPLLDRPLKYYVKNVPGEFKSGFVAAFEEWNENFVAATGKRLLSYEFIDADDPRSPLLVAGDVRFNVIEWDRVNVAPYGGLGPSIANQNTGEIFSGNVLVQGPKIIEMYRKWFDAIGRANVLRGEGLLGEADRLLLQTIREIDASLNSQTSVFYHLKVAGLEFRIPSQTPPLQDPIMQKEGFDEVPAGHNFETYMPLYFQELVAHELGHNIGLRHNFRGNLSATDTPTTGKVSHSVMEYLGRMFRHLNRIGSYDVMAVKYGYLGIEPENKDLFCTDDNVPDVSQPGSAECSRDDATRDPFGYFEQRIRRGIDLLIARGEVTAPEWTVSDMERELGAALKGVVIYASSAPLFGNTWTNFFNGPDRPTATSQVKGYVLSKLRGLLCDSTFQAEVAKKETELAKTRTANNIRDLRNRAASAVIPFGTFTESDLACH